MSHSHLLSFLSFSSSLLIHIFISFFRVTAQRRGLHDNRPWWSVSNYKNKQRADPPTFIYWFATLNWLLLKFQLHKLFSWTVNLCNSKYLSLNLLDSIIIFQGFIIHIIVPHKFLCISLSQKYEHIKGYFSALKT